MIDFSPDEVELLKMRARAIKTHVNQLHDNATPDGWRYLAQDLEWIERYASFIRKQLQLPPIKS